MIEFRTLGAVDLRGPDGQPLDAVLQRPKCLALLGYLAIASPRGFHRRDTLVGLFWTELDERHARAALSQTLYRLRRWLGADTIVVRGGEEVGVAPDALRCDAAAFQDAIEAGEFERALGLYRGEPLAGFILPDSAEFEQWLAAERVRYRTAASRAARKGAMQQEAAGDTERAVWFARQALALSDDDESELRELVGLLVRTGDRAGALRAYDDFATRLRTEYGAEPDTRTRAVIEELRRYEPIAAAPARVALVPRVELSALAPAAAPPALPPRPAAPGSPPAPAPVATGPATGRRFSARGRVTAAAVALAILGAGVWAFTRSEPVRDAPEGDGGARTRVAVFPFVYRGPGGSAYLARGMPNVLGASLDGAGDLASVDHRALLNAVGAAEPASIDAARARDIGARLGASLYILGDIVDTGERLRITATLHDAASSAPLEQATADGRSDDVFPLIDRLAARLLAGRSAARGDNLARSAAMTASSLAALKAYLDGDAEYRAGRYPEAVRALDRAVTLDSTFALAHYRLSSAAHWIAGEDIAKTAVRAALRHQHRLSHGERLLVSAFERYLASDVVVAEVLYRQALGVRPDDVEAWFQLAEVQFHWRSYFGRTPLESKAAFERVLAYEPHHPGALIHLARIAAWERSPERLDSLAARIGSLSVDARHRLELDALRALVLRDTAVESRSLRALSVASDQILESIVGVIAAHATGNLPGAVRIARLQTAPDRNPFVRGRGHILVAQLELARGRWDAAQGELRRLEAIQPGWALQYRAAYGAFPFLGASRGTLRALRDAVEHPPALPAVRENSYAPRPIFPPRQHYLAGLLSVRLDDPYGALRHAVELERPTSDSVETRYGRAFAPMLRAALASAQGRDEEALRLLGDPGIPGDSTRPTISSFPDADARFLKAELLRVQGRLRESLGVYESFPDPGAYDLVYLAPSHLRRAQVHERLGNAAAAIAHYRQVLEIWRDADARFGPWVDEARAGLARLGS